MASKDGEQIEVKKCQSPSCDFYAYQSTNYCSQHYREIHGIEIRSKYKVTTMNGMKKSFIIQPGVMILQPCQGNCEFLQRKDDNFNSCCCHVFGIPKRSRLGDYPCKICYKSRLDLYQKMFNEGNKDITPLMYEGKVGWSTDMAILTNSWNVWLRKRSFIMFLNGCKLLSNEVKIKNNVNGADKREIVAQSNTTNVVINDLIDHEQHQLTVATKPGHDDNGNPNHHHPVIKSALEYNDGNSAIPSIAATVPSSSQSRIIFCLHQPIIYKLITSYI
jgi:hypothetical protein